MAQNLDKTALILTGGGARGAYQVGVLCALADLIDARHNPFDVVTGVSVGAINAAALTAKADRMGQAIRELGQLWHDLHTSDIYRTDFPFMTRTVLGYLGSGLFGWAGVSPPPSMLSAEPLAALLRREVDFERLAEMVEGPTLDALAITASSYRQGTSVSFYHGSVPVRPWKRSRRIGIPGRIGPEHILASAALPFVFPAAQVGREWYGDGALRQIAPLSPAIHLGCDRLFLIGARDAGIGGEPETDDVPYPTAGVVAGQLLDIVFNDNLEADVERLKRINSTLETMTEERRAQVELHHVDVLMIQPSEDVRTIAARHVEQLPWSVKALLRALGAWKAPWVLPSYLMFEPGYVRELMALGKRDAEAQIDEIIKFLRL